MHGESREDALRQGRWTAQGARLKEAASGSETHSQQGFQGVPGCGSRACRTGGHPIKMSRFLKHGNRCCSGVCYKAVVKGP